MKLTRTKPTRSGWYWVKQRQADPVVVHVYPAPGYNSVLWVNGLVPLKFYKGLWAGPLEVPE